MLCKYCGANKHRTKQCGAKVLDMARKRGFLVDFPEEAESNRVAGEARMKAYGIN
jgi:hypothetical protein